jgi:hypothetical protein
MQTNLGDELYVPNKKTNSYKHRSANTFFLSYSMANLVTVSSDILNWVICFL